MGFVQFSGTETEPAKSGPGVSRQLALIYRECLAAFDHYYISSVFEPQLKAQVPRNPAQISPQIVEVNRANLTRTYADQMSFQSRLRPTNQNDAQGSDDQNEPSGGGPDQQLPFGGPATQQNLAVSLRHQHLSQQLNRFNLLVPLRDPIEAAQEWRDRQEAEVLSRANHRRHRPGVVFDVKKEPFQDKQRPKCPLNNPPPQQRSLQEEGPSMQTMWPKTNSLEKSQQFVQNVKRGYNTTSK